jgi:hypothetical protein
MYRIYVSEQEFQRIKPMLMGYLQQMQGEQEEGKDEEDRGKEWLYT